MMAQFDVVANPDADESAFRPYLVVLQSDLGSGLSSTVVAPLVPCDQMKGANRMNPIVKVDGQEFWLATHELFAVDRRMLRNTVASLSPERDAITAALDFVAEYLASGRRSLRGLAETVGYVAVDWPADPEDPFFNINTSADLAEAERRIQR